jgi:hypothetical protein
MVDDTRPIDLVLHGFRKAEQHIAAIHLTAGEPGCPAGDTLSFARAIQNVLMSDESKNVLIVVLLFCLIVAVATIMFGTP